jgi:chromosomal replication initiation ATPase DnaA
MALWFAQCDKFLERESLQPSNAPMRGTLEKGVDHPKIWLEEIVALVCLEINMNPKLVWSPRRFKELTEARFLIWALAREFCWQHSLPTIGKFCKRDHTTVMHGAKQGKKNPAYPELARQVCVILSERELGG